MLTALAIATLAALTPLQDSPSGTLTGMARLSPRLTAMRLRVRVYSEPGDPGATEPAAAGRSAYAFSNVVLYLADAGSLRNGTDSTPPAPAMRQRGERFTPHVLAVTTGTTVQFPNDDPIYHNVFSLSRVRSFDLGRYPKGESKSVRFATPGVVQVFCHIHADMNGYVLVLPNRYFTIPDSLGRFTINGIPAGDYRLVAWHERIRPIVTTVRIDPGRTTTLDLSIPVAK